MQWAMRGGTSSTPCIFSQKETTVDASMRSAQLGQNKWQGSAKSLRLATQHVHIRYMLASAVGHLQLSYMPRQAWLN